MIETAKARILVTRKLPPAVETRLGQSFTSTFNPDDTLPTSESLAQMSAGYDALLVCSTEKLGKEVIDALPDTIRIIATFSVGTDHIDIAAAAARGIVVTNTPDVLTDATADIAMLLMLGAARGAYDGERTVREDRWDVWCATHPLGVQVTGKTVGILGMGRIGRAFAKRARGFDMKILYHGRNRLDPSLENGEEFDENLDDMLARSDFLSIHCASTPTTRGLINATSIAKLPDGAVIVNTARGDIIDDDALISALKSGKLAAAGLDVFNNEPNIDPRYRELENVFLLPHLGSATIETRDAMGFRAIDNLEAFFSGGIPRDIVSA